MSEPKFIDGCVSGDYLVDEVDDFVSMWHAAKPTESLPDFLGMSRDEYDLWVADDDILPLIVAARTEHVPIEQLLEEISNYAIAARSAGNVDVRGVLSWLESKGYGKSL
ncbi:MAG: hypothetical protein RLY86_3770 [Pseudomonadota bacterium]|jgi:hypothetical protein